MDMLLSDEDAVECVDEDGDAVVMSGYKRVRNTLARQYLKTFFGEVGVPVVRPRGWRLECGPASNGSSAGCTGTFGEVLHPCCEIGSLKLGLVVLNGCARERLAVQKVGSAAGLADHFQRGVASVLRGWKFGTWNGCAHERLAVQKVGSTAGLADHFQKGVASVLRGWKFGTWNGCARVRPAVQKVGSTAGLDEHFQRGVVSGPFCLDSEAQVQGEVSAVESCESQELAKRDLSLLNTSEVVCVCVCEPAPQSRKQGGQEEKRAERGENDAWNDRKDGLGCGFILVVSLHCKTELTADAQLETAMNLHALCGVQPVQVSSDKSSCSVRFLTGTSDSRFYPGGSSKDTSLQQGEVGVAKC
eukprot:1152724-Pelagomonas_calceolata.AAC.2